MKSVLNDSIGKLGQLLALLVLLAACSSGSVPGEDEEEGSGGSGPTACSGCPCVGDLDVFQSQGNNSLCSIGGTLTGNAFLPALGSGRMWSIRDSITVDSGIFTIQKGAELFGEQGEYLYVRPGASLRAIGTVDEPIRFLSFDSDFDLEKTASTDDGWIGIVIEETSSSTSTRLEYVVVAEAGEPDNIGGNNVSASISLIGEHEETVLQNVQVHDSFADGIALLGNGDINQAKLENILVTGSGRDGIYFDDFSGLLKDFLVLHRSGSFSFIANGGGRATGGRAGIHAGGSLSIPLVVNGTVVGNDTSTAVGDADELEVGILFDNAIDEIRFANLALVNFRNGCYSVSASVDLGSITDGSSPLDSFIDGVHCVNEQTIGISANVLVDLGGVEIPPAFTGSGNVNGLGFYEGTNVLANFYSEANGSADLSAAWFLESIVDAGNNSLANGGPTGLILYNGGDPVIFDPNLGDPLFDGVSASGDIHFFYGAIPGDLPANFIEFINPNTRQAIDPQPTSGSRAGFIRVSTASVGFNLGVIGGIASDSSNSFDGWTLHECGSVITDNDFCP